jgi:hypothetical protein
MEQHPYGEQVLKYNSPPSGATGLIIRQWYERDEQYGSRSWFGKLVFDEPPQRYFIFKHISGTYDYWCSHNKEFMCGGYTAVMGYWHYDTEEERDRKYAELIKEK